jgi:CubicO group peptidase (beta-lactamase class C family)
LQHDNWSTNWKTDPPEAQGMDSTVLAKIDDYIADAFPTLLSLLIVRHGSLVFEHYYQGCHAGDSVNVKSVTKSIVSSLVGIALREHSLASLDQRLMEFFPRDFPAGGDPRKRAITLRHLLTLRSGLSWAESSAESLPALFASDNWVRHGLSLPLVYAPGEVFAYSTLDVHLLSAVLTQVTGMSTLAFANRSLLGPLGSRATAWATDPQGNSIGGSELYLTPRDLAKVGYLYLRRGRWEDTLLIQEEYLEASTCTQVFPGGSVVVPDTYGYLWWVSTVGPYASFYAIGYGGQTIYVIPALDVVLITTARWDVPADLGAGPRTFLLVHDLAEQFVLPAVAQS